MMRVNCPGCGKLLQCDPGPSGKKIACPSCRRVFAVSPSAEAITTVEPISGSRAEDIPEVLPGDTEASGPARLAHQFARDEGLDAREVFDGSVADEREATALLSEWRQEMPEVPSAYTPSGVLPVQALVLMIVGSLAGAGAGLLVGSLIAAIGGAIVALIAYFIALLLFCGFIWYFIIIIGFILALVAVAGTFAAAGWVSA